MKSKGRLLKPADRLFSYGIVHLSLTLVVRDTFCLRSLGRLGSKSKDDQGDDVRHHIIDRTGDVQAVQEPDTDIDVGQSTEQTEEQSRQCNTERFPLTEDHNSKR